MKLPSMIKGWFNNSSSPELLLQRYVDTQQQGYLTALVELFNDNLYHYLLTQSDSELAKDVLQTTWLKVMTKASYFQVQQSNASVKAWLFSIARNSLIDELRKLSRWQFEPLEQEHTISDDLLDSISSAQALARFNRLLESLPFHQKEAFVLQQEGFSLVEIAMLTGVEHETVKSRLRYARNFIKRYLEKNNEC